MGHADDFLAQKQKCETEAPLHICDSGEKTTRSIGRGSLWEASVPEKKTPEVGVLITPTRLAGQEDEEWEIILDLQEQEHSRIVGGPRSFVGAEASVFQYRRKTK